MQFVVIVMMYKLMDEAAQKCFSGHDFVLNGRFIEHHNRGTAGGVMTQSFDTQHTAAVFAVGLGLILNTDLTGWNSR